MRRSRFQQGSLQLVERAGSRKAWEYRWYEVQSDGSRKRRNLVMGTLGKYPNETAAQRAVAALRADINAESPHMNLTPMSVQMLVEHYREKELGEDSGKTYATRLKANGEDVKTVQELLRHANSLVTINLYAQAITQNKRDAQSKIVSMLFDKKQTA